MRACPGKLASGVFRIRTPKQPTLRRYVSRSRRSGRKGSALRSDPFPPSYLVGSYLHKAAGSDAYEQVSPDFRTRAKNCTKPRFLKGKLGFAKNWNVAQPS